MLEDQGREVAKLVLIEPFQRVLFDFSQAAMLTRFWIRVLVPSPPLMARMHAFCAAQGATVPPLHTLHAACANSIIVHATLRQQDQTLECDTLCMISAYRVNASSFEMAQNCQSILWPAPDQPLSWIGKLKKLLVTSMSVPGSPLVAQCKRVAEAVAQGDHFFMLDPKKSRPALAKVAAFFTDSPPYGRASCVGVGGQTVNAGSIPSDSAPQNSVAVSAASAASTAPNAYVTAPRWFRAEEENHAGKQRPDALHRLTISRISSADGPQPAPALRATQGRLGPLLACLNSMNKCRNQAHEKRPAYTAEGVGGARVGVRVGPNLN